MSIFAQTVILPQSLLSVYIILGGYFSTFNILRLRISSFSSIYRDVIS